jgi:hypothetical protein
MDRDAVIGLPLLCRTGSGADDKGSPAREKDGYAHAVASVPIPKFAHPCGDL